jgi:hypothetical protein
VKYVDQGTLFTALAFVAVVQNGKSAADRETAEQIRRFAELMGAFCGTNIADDLAPDADIAGIDKIIARHIGELRQKEETRLPEDRATLIRLYDRLCQRKARRMQRELYASGTEAQLADLVLQFLDEEIADDGTLT